MSAPKRAEANRGARLSREQRREHLLDVTAELVLEIGADAVTMEGVAAAAGVSKGLGYVYFANRAELLRALLEREREHLNARSLARAESATTFEERVRALNGVLDRWLREGRPRTEVEEAYVTSVLGAVRAWRRAPRPSDPESPVTPMGARAIRDRRRRVVRGSFVL